MTFQFWFETLRVFGHASYGGADFGEVVATASQISAGDYDGWHDAWLPRGCSTARGCPDLHWLDDTI